MEVWAAIQHFEGLYEISSLGQVRSCTRVIFVSGGGPGTGFSDYRPLRERLLRQSIASSRRYRAVTLSKDGRPYRKLVHQLVCEAFHGPRPEGKQVCHRDGNNNNNNEVNLRWATAKENMADCVVHDTIAHGSRNGWSKLTEDQVGRIKALLLKKTDREIATGFGVHKDTIRDIRIERTWKRVLPRHLEAHQ